MRTRIAIGASLLALVAGIAIVLSQGREERTGVNGIAPQSYVASLRPGQRICQPATLPAGTRAVGLTVGVYGRPGPPLALTFTGPGGTLHGALAQGYGGGAISVGVPASARQASGLLCVRNQGTSRLALAGVPAVGAVSAIDGRPSRAALEIDYLHGSASGFALGTTVARRVGALHGGAWLLWVLVALMAAVSATAVALVVREVRE